MADGAGATADDPADAKALSAEASAKAEDGSRQTADKKDPQ